MNRLVRTELLKLRTTRLVVAAVLAAPVFAALVTLAIYSAAGHQGNDPLGPLSLVQAIGGPAGVITLISVLLGVLGMAGEYRHQTITTTFLATPRRREVVLGKLAAHALTGALMGVLSLVVSLAIAVPWLHSSGVAIAVDSGVVRVAVGLVVSSALYGTLGVAVGALIRNQTAAAAAVLVWLLAVEGLISNVFSRYEFVHWLPAATGAALVHVAGTGKDVSVPLATATFIGYVCVLAFAATRLTLRRDIS